MWREKRDTTRNILCSISFSYISWSISEIWITFWTVHNAFVIIPMLPLLPCIPRARQQQQQQQCSEFSLGHEEELVQRLCVDSNEKIPCQPFFPSPILPLHDDVPTLLSYILYTVVYICYTNCPRYPPRG